jgi:hypothetical protein
MFVNINQSTLAAGMQLADEMRELGDAKTDADNAAGSSLASSVSLVVNQSQQVNKRIEPVVTPASSLAIGIALNEEIKAWGTSAVLKTRKNNYVKVLLGTATPQELSRDAPSIINSEPPPLLTICDMHTDLEPTPHAIGHEAPLKSAGNCEATLGVGLTVCGDAAVRVPEATATLLVIHKEAPLRGYMLARSLLLTACSQSSYISNVGPAISASQANSAIASSKKIAVRCFKSFVSWMCFKSCFKSLCTDRRCAPPASAFAL